MPITITIEATPSQLLAIAQVLNGGAAMVQTNDALDQLYPEMTAAEAVEAGTQPKPARQARKPKAESPPAQSPEDAELAAEIARDVAEAPPEPKGATAVVDAGTGRPIEQVQERAMTMDEVRAAATRLAQQDAPKLKAVLGEFGAGKLSEVPPDSLGDFAARVLAELG